MSTAETVGDDRYDRKHDDGAKGVHSRDEAKKSRARRMED